MEDSCSDNHPSSVAADMNHSLLSSFDMEKFCSLATPTTTTTIVNNGMSGSSNISNNNTALLQEATIKRMLAIKLNWRKDERQRRRLIHDHNLNIGVSLQRRYQIDGKHQSLHPILSSETGVDQMVLNEDLFLAAGQGKLARIKPLLLQGANPNASLANYFGMTPMHRAARHGHLYALNLMAEFGGDVNVVNTYGFTPLHRAVTTNDLQTVSWLVSHGADPLIMDYKGETPFDLAKRYNHKAIVTFLVAVINNHSQVHKLEKQLESFQLHSESNSPKMDVPSDV